MIGFVFIGPILLALQGICRLVRPDRLPRTSSPRRPRAATSTPCSTTSPRTRWPSTSRGSLLLSGVARPDRGDGLRPAAGDAGGLLTRFFATLGMALGASALFIVPAISLLALMLWFGWLGFDHPRQVAARGARRLGMPASAIPWPKPGRAAAPVPAARGRRRRGRRDRGVRPRTTARDHSARRERARSASASAGR